MFLDQLEHGFRSSCLTLDFLTGVADKIAIALNMSGALGMVACNILNASDRFWDAGLFQKLRPYEIPGQVFSLIYFHI